MIELHENDETHSHTILTKNTVVRHEQPLKDKVVIPANAGIQDIAFEPTERLLSIPSRLSVLLLRIVFNCDVPVLPDLPHFQVHSE
jgi:hypothetical protein